MYILHIRGRTRLERKSGYWWSENMVVSSKIKEEGKNKEEKSWKCKKEGVK